MAIDSTYKSSRAKQSKAAFNDYFGRSGVTNRPIPKGTTISPRTNSNTPRREENNDNRGNVVPSTSEVRNRVVDPTALSSTQLQDMIDMGFNPARRDTSGNIINPYGSGGLRDYISFPNLEQNQINEIYNKRVSRFLNPLDQDPTSLKRGFGSLFGSSEGEPTISGPLRKQLPEGGMSTPDMIARGVASLMTPFGPIIAMTDPRGTTVVPEGSPNYDPSMDPRNKDTSMLGNMLNFFTGGAGTEAGSRIKELLPDLSNLLPGGGEEVLPSEGPVANPFYPDMQRQQPLVYPDMGIGFEDVPDINPLVVTSDMLPPGDREAAIEAYRQGDQLSPDLGEHIQKYYETQRMLESQDFSEINLPSAYQLFRDVRNSPVGQGIENLYNLGTDGINLPAFGGNINFQANPVDESASINYTRALG